jgi:hypothetical protein
VETKEINTMATSVAIVLCYLVLPTAALAQAAVGAPELALVQGMLSGNYGLLIGLGTAFAGVYKLAAKADAKGGILLILLGVLFTVAPGIYNGTRLIVCPIAKSLAPTAACD